MPHFTEEQLDELATIFGLIPAETLPVRDGVVTKTSEVWLRCVHGPEKLVAGDPVNWENIKKYPEYYQLARPMIHVVYLD